MKKKLLSVLLASSMVLSLAACGASSETAPQSTDTQQPQSTETTASDANNDLHRGRTWHGGESYADELAGGAYDNHDN